MHLVINEEILFVAEHKHKFKRAMQISAEGAPRR